MIIISLKKKNSMLNQTHTSTYVALIGADVCYTCQTKHMNSQTNRSSSNLQSSPLSGKKKVITAKCVALDYASRFILCENFLVLENLEASLFSFNLFGFNLQVCLMIYTNFPINFPETCRSFLASLYCPLYSCIMLPSFLLCMSIY